MDDYGRPLRPLDALPPRAAPSANNIAENELLVGRLACFLRADVRGRFPPMLTQDSTALSEHVIADTTAI